jgi:hypothetical protein
MFANTITLTYSDVAESDPNMKSIGEIGNGFTCEELVEAKSRILPYVSNQSDVEIVKLEELVKDSAKIPRAHVLIIRGGVDTLLKKYGTDKDAMYREQSLLTPDKYTWSRKHGKVVNKRARHNLIFADYDQAPNYENKVSTVVSYAHLPHMQAIREQLPLLLGEKARNLLCEGNYYYDRSCGIGFHGDGERKKVVGVRLGATIPLVFQWFYQKKPASERIVINFNHGDMYVMSEYTVGTNWMSSNVYTLRHSAGADKYTHYKKH